MRKTLSILTLILATISASSYSQCACSATKHGAAISGGTECSGTPQTKDGIKVYYFHMTRRCETCVAVEDVTNKTVSENYKNKIPFQSVNIEKDDKNPLIAKYKISGQTLLIIKGDKVVDLTNTAFLNAMTTPHKLSDKIKKAIETI